MAKKRHAACCAVFVKCSRIKPANDAWTARLVTPAHFPSGQRDCLELSWYQDGGDPFLRLVEIFSTLDFMLYSLPEIASLFRELPKQVSFGMRPMNDKQGLPLKIGRISGDYAREGMLEGTPYLERRFRLIQGRTRMESPGIYVDGLDVLEREIAELKRDCEVWAPNESWCAKVVTDTDWNSCLRHYVHLHWFQEGGDPLGRLAVFLPIWTSCGTARASGTSLIPDAHGACLSASRRCASAFSLAFGDA